MLTLLLLGLPALLTFPESPWKYSCLAPDIMPANTCSFLPYIISTFGQFWTCSTSDWYHLFWCPTLELIHRMWMTEAHVIVHILLRLCTVYLIEWIALTKSYDQGDWFSSQMTVFNSFPPSMCMPQPPSKDGFQSCTIWNLGWPLTASTSKIQWKWHCVSFRPGLCEDWKFLLPASWNPELPYYKSKLLCQKERPLGGAQTCQTWLRSHLGHSAQVSLHMAPASGALWLQHPKWSLPSDFIQLTQLEEAIISCCLKPLSISVIGYVAINN